MLTHSNSYGTSLRGSSDRKTAVFLKWFSDSHATPDTSALYLLDTGSHTVTLLIVAGLD